MKVRFADSYFYIAVLDTEDQHHQRVRTATDGRDDFHVTTRWVLAEVADAFSAPAMRSLAGPFLKDLETDPGTMIMEPSDELYQRGMTLWQQRPDKAWSLTDCISFAVMEARGLAEALTGDRHFAQAGFVAVFAD